MNEDDIVRLGSVFQYSLYSLKLEARKNSNSASLLASMVFHDRPLTSFQLYVLRGCRVWLVLPTESDHTSVDEHKVASTSLICTSSSLKPYSLLYEYIHATLSRYLSFQADEYQNARNFIS